MAQELKLFRTWSSPYALRVVHALKIKGLEYETVFEDLTNKSASLLEYNPVHEKVPVLVHNGKPICESLVILEYVDEVWKQFPLLPRDPYDRAMARFWAKFGEDKVLLSIWGVFISKRKGLDEAIGQAIENLKFLENQLKGKKFFGGQTIGYLDIALGWMANLISILEEIADLKLVDPEIFPLLSAWMIDFADYPLIKECWPPRDKMVEKFKAMREPYLEKSE
ncbi:glutathione s-transferase [Striga asiatica]|uniref:Probable glutathione S-transferase n=1 Tax=Striga asiatica TaxID=4170 RepID=A0A5A7QUZ8_STRAF|nr:glutathione s-transferase [Striga asiatica]